MAKTLIVLSFVLAAQSAFAVDRRPGILEPASPKPTGDNAQLYEDAVESSQPQAMPADALDAPTLKDPLKDKTLYLDKFLQRETKAALDNELPLEE